MTTKMKMAKKQQEALAAAKLLAAQKRMAHARKSRYAATKQQRLLAKKALVQPMALALGAELVLLKEKLMRLGLVATAQMMDATAKTYGEEATAVLTVRP